MISAISIRHVDDYLKNLTDNYGFTYQKGQGMQEYIAPKEIGNGYIKLLQVSDDIEISVTKLNLSRPIVMYYEDYDSMYETTCCFNGRIVYSETGVIETNVGHNEFGMYLNPKSRGMMMYPSGEDIFSVSLLGKNNFLTQLPFREKCVNSSSSTYRDLLHSLMKPRKMNIQMQNYFSQIVKNNMGMELQPVFMEGISKMILSTLWQNSIVNPLEGNRAVNQKYSAFDRKAIQEAREILNTNYMSPPTTSELVKMVALNEYKLKTGFRELYGKSVYEYVRGLRMENAKYLLENNNLSISQIAGMVGYINTSHFARAFRNEYGVNPSDFRIGV